MIQVCFVNYLNIILQVSSAYDSCITFNIRNNRNIITTTYISRSGSKSMSAIYDISSFATNSNKIDIDHIHFCNSNVQQF